MVEKRSREAALEFLEYVAQKGLMAPATARARKAALSKVLGILSPEEAQDVTSLDLDELMTRFSHLQGKSYTPQSLTTYKSRVRSALDDFASYVDNPLGFKPSLQSRERKSNSGKSQGSNSQERRRPEPATEGQARPSAPAPAGPMSSSILPIPLRADLTVHVQGLPFDLTPAEAKKIASVVQAMAMERDED